MPILAGVLIVAVLAGGAAVAWRIAGADDNGGDGTKASTATDSTATPRQSSGNSPSGSAAAAVPTGDEFDAPLDDRWGVYASSSENGSTWSKDAVQVEGGILRITGTGRNPTGSGNVAGGLCWCGSGGDRTYGVWTVRARFDAGAGYGPSLMLWPKSDKATDGFATFAGLSSGDRKTVRSMVMWGAAGQKSESTLAGDFTQWHVYRVEWRAGSLKMFVDDKVLFDSAAAKPATVVPTTPMHLVIQVVAGPKDGVPAATAATPDKVATEVDWVRYTA